MNYGMWISSHCRGNLYSDLAPISTRSLSASLRFPWRFNVHDVFIATQLGNLSSASIALAKKYAVTAASKVSAKTGVGFAEWANFVPAAPNSTGDMIE